MAVQRDETPYGAFNFIVALGGDQGTGDEGQIVGGFSDVSGLGIEVSYSEYRNGNEKVNTARKVPNTYKLDDVTLKRGLVGSTRPVRLAQGGPRRRGTTRATSPSRCSTRRATRSRTWRLRSAQPKKWVGPTLAAKGGGEVAMEELHLVHEGIEYS